VSRQWSLLATLTRVASLLVNDDIEAVIERGEKRTAEISNKYEGLTFEDLNNFKSDTMIQQWEGEDFRGMVGTLLSVYPASLKQHPYQA